jgi:hypothetical protein
VTVEAKSNKAKGKEKEKASRESENKAKVLFLLVDGSRAYTRKIGQSRFASSRCEFLITVPRHSLGSKVFWP